MNISKLEIETWHDLSNDKFYQLEEIIEFSHTKK